MRSGYGRPMRVLCFYLSCDHTPTDASDEVAREFGPTATVEPVPLPGWRQPADPQRTEDIRRTIARLRSVG